MCNSFGSLEIQPLQARVIAHFFAVRAGSHTGTPERELNVFRCPRDNAVVAILGELTILSSKVAGLFRDSAVADRDKQMRFHSLDGVKKLVRLDQWRWESHREDGLSDVCAEVDSSALQIWEAPTFEGTNQGLSEVTPGRREWIRDGLARDVYAIHHSHSAGN